MVEMQEKMSQNANMHIHHGFQSAILDCSDVKVTLSSRSRTLHELNIFSIFFELLVSLIISTESLSELCPVLKLPRARKIPQ